MSGEDSKQDYTASSKVVSLKFALCQINEAHYPHLASPPSCKTRASVALILRIRPGSDTGQKVAAIGDNVKERLHTFFRESWVQAGDPEVLFIKRAARVGDRWTGHTAFPGGKREPGDQDDQATAIRETREEIGLDLDSNECLHVGRLPERLITVNWGRTPIMVLCSYVYLWLRPDLPKLNLQAAEVHSIHWVPTHMLLSPSVITNHYCDVSDRLKQPRGPMLRRVMRVLIGRLTFPAIRLVPSQSMYSDTITTNPSDSMKTNESSLILWGITLGVLCDFLDEVDRDSVDRLRVWPSFSHWDIRMAAWVLSYRLRHSPYQSHARVSQETRRGNEAVSEPNIVIDDTNVPLSRQARISADRPDLNAVHKLDAYFRLMGRSILVALAFRANVILIFIAYIMLRCRETMDKVI